jgi:glutaredoxin 3
VPDAPREHVQAGGGAGLVTSLIGAAALIAAVAAVAFGLSVFDVITLTSPAGSRSETAVELREDRASPDVTEGVDPVTPAAAPQVKPAHVQDTPAEQSNESAQRAQFEAQRAEQARRERELARETAAQDLRRKQAIEADWQQRSKRQARNGIVVVMYSTSWCPSCVAARSYMDSHDIAYVDHDIDQSDSARTIMRRLNPRGSVPTIDIDGDVVVGFGPSQIESALDRAARKRAGI